VLCAVEAARCCWCAIDGNHLATNVASVMRLTIHHRSII
jgi:hypothetical protein